MDLRRFLGGTGFFIFGVAVSVGSYKLGLGGLHKPGTGFVPFLAGVIMAFLSMADLIKALLPGNGERKTLPSLWKGLYWKRAASIVIMTSLYALLLNLTGFLILTPFYIGSCMRVLGYRKWFNIGVAVVFSTLAFYLLAHFFGLSIPLFPGG